MFKVFGVCKVNDLGRSKGDQAEGPKLTKIQYGENTDIFMLTDFGQTDFGQF